MKRLARHREPNRDREGAERSPVSSHRSLTVAAPCILGCLIVLSAVVAIPAAGDDLATREQAAFQAAIARVAPSVVRIETVGGRDRSGNLLLGAGPTTGLIVAPDGLIVSSAFNFIGRPDSILVQLPDGSRKPARLVATDHSRMMALLAIEPDEPLAAPEMAPRRETRVGQWAVAIGRTFEGNRPNVSVGIVSAASRVGGRAIQTDAAVSPNNYGGPLVDVRGRVLGVLTPLSPEPDEETAGIEWYDSGIGFAVPAEDILRVLPRLRKGEDLRRGRLGVSFAARDPNTAEPIVAACHPRSPAYATLKPGDRITAVDGATITRLADLENVLGRHYAGDRVTLGIERDGKPRKEQLTLVADLPPYERPFLGILPRRDAAATGGPAGVRFVFPNSAAAKAGIESGDLIVSLAGEPLAGADDLRQRMALLQSGDRVKLDVRRGEQVRHVVATLGRLPNGVPDEKLPPAREEKRAEGGQKPKNGKAAIAASEIENKAWVYVPAGYGENAPCGVVVWLDSPGAVDDDAILRLWQPVCDRDGLILLAVKPVHRTAWLPSEEAAVARLLDEVVGRYAVDAHRIVVHGHQGGGTLAALVAFRHRELVRAVATVDAALPGLPPAANPVQSLAFYLATFGKSSNAARIDRSVKAIGEARHPVVVQSIDAAPRYLLPNEIDRLARWIDTLDQI